MSIGTIANQRARLANLPGVPRLTSRAWLIIATILAGSFVVGAASARPGLTLLPVVFLAVPAGLAIVRYPFHGFLVWMAIAPFVSVRGSAALQLLYLGAHRLMIASLFLVVIMELVAKRQSLRIGLPEVLLAAFAFFSVATLMFVSSTPVADLLALYDRMLLPFGVYFIAKHLVDRPDRFKSLMIVLLFVALLQGAFSMMGEIPGLRAILPQQWFHRDERISGSIGNPVAFGATMVMMLVLLSHARRYVPSMNRGILIKATYLLAGISIALTFSRSVWLSVVLVLLLSSLIQRHTLKSVAPIVVLTFVLIVSGPLSQYLSYAEERLNNQDTIYGRIQKIQASINMIEDRPAFGFGYRQMENHFAGYLRKIPNLTEYQPRGGSHHTFLTMLVESGFVGFALYALAIIVIVRRSIYAARALPRQGLWSRELMFALWIALAVHFWVSNTMDMRFFSFALAFAWFNLGVVAALTEQAGLGDRNLARNRRLVRDLAGK